MLSSVIISAPPRRGNTLSRHSKPKETGGAFIVRSSDSTCARRSRSIARVESKVARPSMRWASSERFHRSSFGTIGESLTVAKLMKRSPYGNIVNAVLYASAEPVVFTWKMPPGLRCRRTDRRNSSESRLVALARQWKVVFDTMTSKVRSGCRASQRRPSSMTISTFGFRSRLATSVYRGMMRR